MAGREDLDEAVERAWREFRLLLADRLAALEGTDDDVGLQLNAEIYGGVHEIDLPWINCFDDAGGVEVSAAGRGLRDPRFHPDDADLALMRELGWDDPGGRGTQLRAHVPYAQVDQLAVMLVRTLREVHHCPHPAFLGTYGLDYESADAEDDEGEGEPEPLAVHAEDADELRELVLGAVTVMLGSTPAHSDDGLIPIRCGQTVVMVSVQDAVPVIELRSVLAAQVRDLERARSVVAGLNERFDLGTFVLRGDRVVMKHYLPAWPFAPAQLRLVLSRMCEMVDVLAGEVVAQIGGRRHLDPPLPETRPEAVVDEVSPLAGLLELLHDGPLQPRVVAALFGNRRQAITAQLVRLRTGRDLPDDHDLERVLAELRAALRFVAEREALPPLRRTTPARRARSQQLSLISGDDAGEEVLDLGGCAG